MKHLPLLALGTRAHAGSLAMCIGLHAGWALAVETATFAAHLSPAASPSHAPARFWFVAQPAGRAAVAGVFAMVHVSRGRIVRFAGG